MGILLSWDLWSLRVVGFFFFFNYFPNIVVTALTNLRLFWFCWFRLISSGFVLLCEFLLCCLNSQSGVLLIQKKYDVRISALPGGVTAFSVTATFLPPFLPFHTGGGSYSCKYDSGAEKAGLFQTASMNALHGWNLSKYQQKIT